MNKLRALMVGAVLLTAADAALAERVYVKSRGEVDLAPFRCEGVARSPNVKRICYDAPHRYVLVSLKGIWYHYCGVPVTTVNTWKRAFSKGRYYNDYVRDNFDCTVTPPPAYR